VCPSTSRPTGFQRDALHRLVTQTEYILEVNTNLRTATALGVAHSLFLILVRRILQTLLAVATLHSTSFAQTKPDPQGSMPELQFKDFYKLPIGPKGLEMSERLLKQNGRSMQITGYMVQQEIATPGQFMLTPRPVQMSEHADGEADDLPATLVLVKLAPDQQDWAVPHARGLIQIRGVLTAGRQEARDGRVSWVQLQLNPDATRGMNVMELAGYLHSLQHRH
jgi:hypothetical protein